MARRSPTDQDRAEALRRLLCGLARGDDVFGLAAAIEELHLRHNTFPGEVFLRLVADALDVASVDCDDPVPYEGLREKYLGECRPAPGGFRPHPEPGRPGFTPSGLVPDQPTSRRSRAEIPFRAHQTREQPDRLSTQIGGAERISPAIPSRRVTIAHLAGRPAAGRQHALLAGRPHRGLLRAAARMAQHVAAGRLAG